MNSAGHGKARCAPLTISLLLLAGFRLALAAPDQMDRMPRTAATDEVAASRRTGIGSGGTLDARASEPAVAPAVMFEGGYTAEVLAVVTGGRRRGAVYRGLADAALQCDLAAIAGAPADTVFRLSALLPHGGDFSGARLGDLQGASNIEAYNHPLLYELWFGGNLGGGFLAWRAGRLLADGDFATTESGGVFLNSSFGWPAFISANTRNTGPAFYRTSLGVFARLALTERIHAQAGLYDGDSFDDAGGEASRHPNGLHFELGHGQGRFTLVEITWKRHADPATGGLPGTCKLGAWQHTAEFADQFDPAQSHAGNHGWYVVAEQMLWREPGVRDGGPQGLTIFARTGFSPEDRSTFVHTWDAGLSYTGLWPGRDADTLGLGVAAAKISRDYRRAERAAGAAFLSDFERVVELSYRFVARENWHCVPNLQWIRHPGGSHALHDALVLGLRTRFTY